MLLSNRNVSVGYADGITLFVSNRKVSVGYSDRTTGVTGGVAVEYDSEHLDEAESGEGDEDAGDDQACHG
jgi:hypothetical protein